MTTLDELMDIHRMQTSRGPALLGAYPTEPQPQEQPIGAARPFFPGVKPASREATERPASELADPLLAEGAARTALALPPAMLGLGGAGAAPTLWQALRHAAGTSAGTLARHPSINERIKALGGQITPKGQQVQKSIEQWSKQTGRKPSSDTDWQQISDMAKKGMEAARRGSERVAPSYLDQAKQLLREQFDPSTILGKRGINPRALSTQAGNQYELGQDAMQEGSPVRNAAEFVRGLPGRGLQEALKQFAPRPPAAPSSPPQGGGSPMGMAAATAPHLQQALPGLLQQLDQATKVQPGMRERMALEEYLMSL